MKHSFATYFTTEIFNIPLDKRRCERSEDNKLVIWSKNSSGNPTQTNQSTQANPPRLPYQRLLTRVTSTPPPEGNVSAPVTSPTVGLGEEFPYQKLIKTVPSTESSGQQGSDNGEKPEADVLLCDETYQKPYQSLSLKRNPTVRIFLTIERFFIFFFLFFLVDPCKVTRAIIGPVLLWLLKIIKIPESRKVLPVKYGILDF